MPAKGRTPSNPPRRRPRVAGQSQRTRPGTAREQVFEDPTRAAPEQWADEPVDAVVSEPTVEPASTRPAPPEPEPDSTRRTTDTAAPVRMRPSPRRRAEQAAPVKVAAPAKADAAPPPGADKGRLAASGVQLVVLLLLVALVFGAAAAFFRGQAARAAPGSVENRAVIDTASTSEVVGQVSKAIETVLSYDYTKLDENERTAREVITGRYTDEFGKTFADVRKTAPEQKLVLTTTVLLAGVTVLSGDRAELIATMDLAAVRDTTPYNSPGRVKVVANKVDGRWKIAEMTLL